MFYYFSDSVDFAPSVICNKLIYFIYQLMK